jgi:hypothetical protein
MMVVYPPVTKFLATPALAVPGAGPATHRQVQPRSQQKQTQARNSKANDPYWQPCRYSATMDNTCE